MADSLELLEMPISEPSHTVPLSVRRNLAPEEPTAIGIVQETQTLPAMLSTHISVVHILVAIEGIALA
jgi:hypothetical protein